MAQKKLKGSAYLLIRPAGGGVVIRCLQKTVQTTVKKRGHQLDQILLQGIEECLRKSKVKMPNLRLLVVSLAGQSFVSTRILISVINTLAWINSLKVLVLEDDFLADATFADLMKKENSARSQIAPSYSRPPEIGVSKRKRRFTTD